jgi:predicted amidohydrolase YtcJ
VLVTRHYAATGWETYPDRVSGPASVLLRDAEVVDVGVVDVLLRDGVVVTVGRSAEGAADETVDCGRAALLPGLHDHHIHLLATAAAARSVPCGPPAVRNLDELRAAMLSAAPDADGWIRGVGYDDSVAGGIDAAVLDALRPDVPVRVQHRSGALWVLNSLGLDAVAVGGADIAGVERNGSGQPTGRLWRLDGWLRERLGPAEAVDLAGLSQRLASFGITGVTDATPDLTPSPEKALRSAGLAQRVTSLGDPDGDAPFKIVVADHALPSWDELAERIQAVRPRAVAVHAVTRAALVLVLSVLDQLGPTVDDRIEHAAVAPPDLAAWMGRLGLAVVTQPSFVHLRGDDYLKRVDREDLPHLWPHRSLLDAGVRVACSSDAPYGDPDPWASIAAATRRLTRSGRAVAARQAVTGRQALDGYLGPAERPGGAPRAVARGAPADLVLLDRPLGPALADPTAVTVRATWIGGRRVWDNT